DSVTVPDLLDVKGGRVVNDLKSKPSTRRRLADVEVLRQYRRQEVSVVLGPFDVGRQLLITLYDAQTGVCLLPGAEVSPFRTIIQLIQECQEALVINRTIQDPAR